MAVRGDRRAIDWRWTPLPCGSAGLWRGVLAGFLAADLRPPASAPGAGCRLVVGAFARQLVGGLRYLRFQIFHRRGDVEIAAVAGQVEIERFFEFLGYVAVEILGRRCFFRHAAVTLYKWRGRPKPASLRPRTRLIMDRVFVS